MDTLPEELDRTIDGSSEPLLLCDSDGRIIGANEPVCTLTGYERADLLSRSLNELADPMLSFAQETALDLERHVRCKDGTRTRVLFSLRSLRMAGRPHALIRIARRRRSGDRLLQLPDFLRALTAMPGLLILSVEKDGSIAFASPAFEMLSGLEFRAIRGRKIWELVSDAAEGRLLRAAIANPGSGCTLRLTWPDSAGCPQSSSWTTTLLAAPPSEAPPILLLGRGDVERHVLEHRIAELTAQVDELQREQSAFAYTLAHDLRAPLRSISGFSDTILTEYPDRPLDEEGRNCARRVSKSAHRMDTLIQDLLVYNRLGRIRVRFARIPVAQVVPSILEALAPESRPEGTRIEAEELPGEVVADRTLLSFALYHLVSNALKFVEPGTPPWVSIRTESAGARVRIFVEDRGIGIPAEHTDRIFGVFQTLHTSERHTGTGIGLAIVRRVVSRMRGQVRLESTVGKGSRFCIELPCAAARALSEESPAGDS